MNMKAKIAYMLMLIGFVTVLTSSLLLINIERSKLSSSSVSTSNLIVKINFTNFLSKSSYLYQKDAVEDLYLYLFCNRNSNYNHQESSKAYNLEHASNNFVNAQLVTTTTPQNHFLVKPNEKYEETYNSDDQKNHFKIIQPGKFIKFVFEILICSSDKVYLGSLVFAVLIGIILLVFGCFQFCKYEINLIANTEKKDPMSNCESKKSSFWFSLSYNRLCKMFIRLLNRKKKETTLGVCEAKIHNNINKPNAANHLVVFNESLNNVQNRVFQKDSIGLFSNKNNSGNKVENMCPFIYEDLPAFMVNNTVNNNNRVKKDPSILFQAKIQQQCLNLPPPSRLKIYNNNKQQPPLPPQTLPPASVKGKKSLKTNKSHEENFNIQNYSTLPIIKNNFRKSILKLSSNDNIKINNLNMREIYLGESIDDDMDFDKSIDGYDENFLLQSKIDIRDPDMISLNEDNYDNICMYDTSKNSKRQNNRCSKCSCSELNSNKSSITKINHVDENSNNEITIPSNKRERKFNHIALWKLDGLNKIKNHSLESSTTTKSLDRNSITLKKKKKTNFVNNDYNFEGFRIIDL